ncbi:MAG: hypothetical protein HC895_03695 [Leptolyngbyaceae cyanobacterium SM1_3_5]|nr:hypothetical protein [Leptolyngbyaceae cyanobacterium SM1_3_5]
MDNAKDQTISVHLLAERDRLHNLIAQIRESGIVAPTHCWLVESPQTKGNRTYTYVRLVSDT